MSSESLRIQPSNGAQSGSSLRSGNRIVVFVALLVSFLAYLPSLQNKFVNWDDQVNIYRNPHILRITDWASFLESIKGIFTSDVMGNYNPLPIFSFALEKMAFGLDRPEIFHLTNILLHLVCVFLIFRIASSLGLKRLPAAFCAILFGIHPMRVESVAWVTERKDVLMGAFYFLALYFYILKVRSKSGKRYGWIILFSFILALLSKIQAVALPLSMLLVDYYFDRKPDFKLLLEKWHYFSLSLLTGVAGIVFLRLDGGIAENDLFSPLERILIGAYSYGVYLVKSVVPYELVPVYPYPDTVGGPFYLSLLFVLGLAALIVLLVRRKNKGPVFGLLFFTVNIMFLLQVLGAGQGFLADRFTYIAYFGLFFLYALGFQRLVESDGRRARWAFLAALLILGIYGGITFRQNRIWKNGETLWTHVLEHYPESSLVWENRAGYYSDQKQFKEALEDYGRAIALKPANPAAYYGRGNAHYNSGDIRAALADYSTAVRLSPQTSEYLVKRGIVHFELGRFREALQDLEAAGRFDKVNPFVYSYKARIHFRLGRYENAQTEIEKYLSLNPDDPAMWSNLGSVARLNGEFDISLKGFGEAIRLNREKLEYYYKRSLTYYEMGDFERAREDLEFVKSKGYGGIDSAYETLIYSAD